METNRTKTKKLSVLNAPSSKQNRKQHIQHSKPPHAQQTPTQIRDKNVLASIRLMVDASPQLRSKKKLIEGFIAQLNENELDKLVDSEGNITVYDSNGNKVSIVDCWSEYVEQKYNHDLAQLVQSEGLNDSLTRKFMEKSFSAGEVSELGTDINDLMPRMSRFGAAAKARAEKKSRIVESMRNMFNEFVGLIGFSQYDSQKD